MVDARTLETADQMSHESYTEALGRDPRRDELVYWETFMINNACNPSAMVHWHMNWLRSNAGVTELPQMIGHSYLAVMGRAPKPAETQYWEGQIYDKSHVPTDSDPDDAYNHELHTFDKLCQYHRDWLNAGNLP